MLCLSIRQPWAWLILNAGKDIENRAWPTKVRGRVLVHAAKGMTRDEYQYGVWALQDIRPALQLPAFHELERGGIVGSVEIVDCVSASQSPWFNGDFGFVLRDPKTLEFKPYKGMLGFFNVPDVIPEGVKA